MTFEFSENHIVQFQMHGYTVFDQIIPTSLIRDLRRVSEKAREIAREERGPQVQRLQPVSDYAIDQKPFIDFGELPILVDAISRVLTPRHRPSSLNTLGILLEPSDSPYSTKWHRDSRGNSREENDRWKEAFGNVNYFNQTNCPLYKDSSLWFVPGSHLRTYDLTWESSMFPNDGLKNRIDFQDKSPEEQEVLCHQYAKSMPGSIQLHLEAGDYALYKPTAWHLGNYVPYIKRATLHDHVSTPEYDEWRKMQ